MDEEKERMKEQLSRMAEQIMQLVEQKDSLKAMLTKQSHALGQMILKN